MTTHDEDAMRRDQEKVARRDEIITILETVGINKALHDFRSKVINQFTYDETLSDEERFRCRFALQTVDAITRHIADLIIDGDNSEAMLQGVIRQQDDQKKPFH